MSYELSSQQAENSSKIVFIYKLSFQALMRFLGAHSQAQTGFLLAIGSEVKEKTDGFKDVHVHVPERSLAIIDYRATMLNSMSKYSQ